jgi:7-cyano-7-deazaguanine synthase in queuosine biosynthesis
LIKKWEQIFENNLEIANRNLKNVEDILIMNRGKKEVPYNEYVILLFSGGMDSVTLADIIIKEWNCKVIFLYFERNSKNQKWEKDAILYFFEFYKKRYPKNVKELVILPIEIPSRVNKKYFDRERQEIMGLPLRNNVMWSNAFTQAVYLSGKYFTTIRTVIIGSVKEDMNTPESGIFPITCYNLSMCASLGLWYYQLLAPFIDRSLGKIFDKNDLVNYSIKEKIPLEKSRSCFSSLEEPCNECLACKNRNYAFKKIKI